MTYLPFLCWHIHHEYMVVVSESCFPRYIASISVLPYPLRGGRGDHLSLGCVPHLSITLSLLICCVDRSAMSIWWWPLDMYPLLHCLYEFSVWSAMSIWWWPLDMYPILHCLYELAVLSGHLWVSGGDHLCLGYVAPITLYEFAMLSGHLWVFGGSHLICTPYLHCFYKSAVCWQVSYEYLLVATWYVPPIALYEFAVLTGHLWVFGGGHLSLGYIPHYTVCMKWLCWQVTYEYLMVAIWYVPHICTVWTCCVDRSPMSIWWWPFDISTPYYTVLIFCVDRSPMSIWWWPLDMYPPLHTLYQFAVLTGHPWVFGGGHLICTPHYIVWIFCVDRSPMSIWWWPPRIYPITLSLWICCVDRSPMRIWWWPLDMYPITLSLWICCVDRSPMSIWWWPQAYSSIMGRWGYVYCVSEILYPLSHPFFVCVCLCLSVCVCLCLYVSVCSVCLSVWLCLSVSVSLCLSVSLSLYICLCLCIYVCVSVSVSVCVSVSVYLPVSLYICLCLCMSVCVSVCVFVSLLAAVCFLNIFVRMACFSMLLVVLVFSFAFLLLLF